MFDYHAHIGKPSDEAYICTSRIEEAPLLYPYRYKAVGLLPPNTGDIEYLEEYASRGYGIGEVGLDRRFPDMEFQVEQFRKALRIAKRHHSLVTVHSVGCPGLTLEILSEMKVECFIMHSFTYSLETAREIGRLGGYISLSPKAVKTKHFSSLIHNTSFLIESDMPAGEDEKKALMDFYLYLCSLLDRDITFPSIL